MSARINAAQCFAQRRCPSWKKKFFLIFENSRIKMIWEITWALKSWLCADFFDVLDKSFFFTLPKWNTGEPGFFLSFAVKKILFFDCISSPCLARFMLSTFINNELLNYPDYSPLVHKGGCNSPRLLTDEQLDSFWQCILVWTNQIVSG